MHIIDYKYIKATELRDGYVAIPELDRYKSSVKQFINLADLDITLTKPTAFLYVDGFTVSQAESGINLTCPEQYLPAIKTGSSYVMHEWLYTFGGKEHIRYAGLITSTCASSLQALHEANRLLVEGIAQEVIIIGGERTTDDTVRLFKELRIPILCSDGWFYMKLGHDNLQMDAYVQDIQWKYEYNRNPFTFEKETLDALAPDYDVDYVKLHGTGTASNIWAESGLAMLGEPILYKPLIGHSQGVSCLLETCLVLDDENISGKVLVTANGLGGFYGAFTLIK